MEVLTCFMDVKSIFGIFQWSVLLLLVAMGTAVANSDAVRFSENVNLAMRRTVHQLLLANNDSLTRIPPVKQVDAHTFSVRMDNMLDYGKLPETLQNSLQMHHIGREYNVSVVRCETGEIQLGYNYLDLKQKGGVPCQNRATDAGCYILQVRFAEEKEPVKSGGNGWLLISFAGTLAGLGFVAWNRSRHKKTVEIDTQNTPPLSPRLEFGNSWLDIQNQTLGTGNLVHKLTYRETKLLTFFVKNPNRVIERDAILKSVWEDEGVTVGRSVDVFVSRLRKLLAADALVKISAIHGVGYKMEVQS